MSGQPMLIQTIVSQRSAGTLFNTYTSAKSVINPTDQATIPPGMLAPGSKLKVHVWGGLSNIVTTPGTVTFQIMMGSIAIWTSGAIQMSTTAHTLIPFTLDVVIRMDSEGSGTSAKFIGGGKLNGIMFTVGSGADSTTVVGEFPVPAAAPAVGTGYDSSISNILDFWTGFSISQPTNGVQIMDYDVVLAKWT